MPPEAPWRNDAETMPLRAVWHHVSTGWTSALLHASSPSSRLAASTFDTASKRARANIPTHDRLSMPRLREPLPR